MGKSEKGGSTQVVGEGGWSERGGCRKLWWTGGTVGGFEWRRRTGSTASVSLEDRQGVVGVLETCTVRERGYEKTENRTGCREKVEVNLRRVSVGGGSNVHGHPET